MFSKEQIETAKGVSIIEVMEKFGHQLVPGASTSQNAFYRSPFTEDRTPSFRVKYATNMFSDFSSGLAGSSIDLVMNLNHCSFTDAVNYLLQLAGQAPAVVRQVVKEPIVVIRDVKELTHVKLIEYLQQKRKINIDIAKRYVKEVHWTVDKQDGQKAKFYFAIGFETGKGGAFTCRNELYKGFVGDGAKNYPTFIPGLGVNGTTLNVFEGFMDFLTILTRKQVDTLKHPTLVLNSIVFKTLVNAHIYDTFNTFVDNDNGGQQVVDYLQTVGTVNDMRTLYPTYNDLNEYHINTPIKTRQF